MIELTEQQRRELTEWLGLCWHEWEWDDLHKKWRCNKDGCSSWRTRSDNYIGRHHELNPPKSGDRCTFDTAKDIRLLTDKMVEYTLDISFEDMLEEQNDSDAYYHQLAQFLKFSPTEQSEKIHEFLMNIGKENGGIS